MGRNLRLCKGAGREGRQNENHAGCSYSHVSTFLVAADGVCPDAAYCFCSSTPTVALSKSKYFLTMAGTSSGRTASIRSGYDSMAFQEPSRSNHASRSDSPSRLLRLDTNDMRIEFLIRCISLGDGGLAAREAISSLMIFSTRAGSVSFLSVAASSKYPSWSLNALLASADVQMSSRLTSRSYSRPLRPERIDSRTSSL